jgi:hypothetical protein
MDATAAGRGMQAIGDRRSMDVIRTYAATPRARSRRGEPLSPDTEEYRSGSMLLHGESKYTMTGGCVFEERTQKKKEAAHE